MNNSSNVPQKPCLTCHVLDTSKGKPAINLPVTLYKFVDDKWSLISESLTNNDGRCNDLGDILEKEGNFNVGRYKVHFLVSQYFELTNTKSMYPFIDIVFDFENPSDHYHIPLLLSPFSYTTYRGS